MASCAECVQCLLCGVAQCRTLGARVARGARGARGPCCATHAAPRPLSPAMRRPRRFAAYWMGAATLGTPIAVEMGWVIVEGLP